MLTRSSTTTEKKMKRQPLLTAKQVRDRGLPLIGKLAPKEVRAWAGISQEELSRKSGIPRAAIASLETGRYKLSVGDGIEIFEALVREIPPESPRYREAKEELLSYIAFKRKIDRKKLVDLKLQIERLEKQCEAVNASLAELDSKKARLREL